MMADREKVNQGLDCCLSAKHPIPCHKCDYYNNTDYNDVWSCRLSLMRDARKLLKAQEVSDTNVGKWTTERTQEHDGEWYCSKCGYEPVVMSDDMKYCPGCGRKMLFPEPPKEEA